MRKTIAAALMSAFLFMGFQCSTDDLAKFISDVQKDAVVACGYVPLADFITKVLQTQQGAALLAQGADAFAHMVCDEVHPAHTATHTNAIPTIAGVPIQGHFVK